MCFDFLTAAHDHATPYNATLMAEQLRTSNGTILKLVLMTSPKTEMETPPMRKDLLLDNGRSSEFAECQI